MKRETVANYLRVAAARFEENAKFLRDQGARADGSNGYFLLANVFEAQAKDALELANQIQFFRATFKRGKQ